MQSRKKDLFMTLLLIYRSRNLRRKILREKNGRYSSYELKEFQGQDGMIQRNQRASQLCLISVKCKEERQLEKFKES